MENNKGNEKDTRIVALSNIGKVRKNNEDATFGCITKFGTLLLVADGMGGHRKGDVASKMVSDCFAIAFGDYKKPFNFRRTRKFRRKTLKNANRRIYRMSLSRKEYSQMGTTSTVALTYDKGTFVQCVGDSRCYTYSAETGLRQVSEDQSYAALLFKEGRINRTERKNLPQRNYLLNAVGINRKIVNAEEYNIPNDYDYILACSDGLYNRVSDDDIASILATPWTIKEKADALRKKALDNGGRDNIAVVLTRNPEKNK